MSSEWKRRVTQASKEKKLAEKKVGSAVCSIGVRVTSCVGGLAAW